MARHDGVKVAEPRKVSRNKRTLPVDFVRMPVGELLSMIDKTLEDYEASKHGA